MQESACKYHDYGRVMSIAEVPDCFDVTECLAECHPITDKWGACYVDDKEGVERAQRQVLSLRPPWCVLPHRWQDVVLLAMPSANR